MTFITSHPVHFGAVVRHRTTGVAYLVVGWGDVNKLGAICERPGDPQVRLIHRDLLAVTRPARSWKRRHANR